MYTYNDPICKRMCSTVNSNPWDHVYYMSDQKENSSLCSLVYFRVFSLFGQLERTLLCEAVNQSTLLQTTALQSCISLKKSDGWIVNWLGTLHICIAPFAKGVWYEQKECPCPSPKLVQTQQTDFFLCKKICITASGRFHYHQITEQQEFFLDLNSHELHQFAIMVLTEFS